MMHDASRSHGVADNRNRVRLQIFQEFGRRTFNFRHNTEAWLSVNIHNLHVGNLLERLSYASRCPDKLIEVSFTQLEMLGAFRNNWRPRTADCYSEFWRAVILRTPTC